MKENSTGLPSSKRAAIRWNAGRVGLGIRSGNDRERTYPGSAAVTPFEGPLGKTRWHHVRASPVLGDCCRRMGVFFLRAPRGGKHMEKQKVLVAERISDKGVVCLKG